MIIILFLGSAAWCKVGGGDITFSGLTAEQAISHKDCSLGKWMYAEGLQHYSTIPEMKSLEKVHINLHETVRNIVSLKNKGKAAEAEAEYLKIGPIPDEIINLLTVIEKKVSVTE